VLYLRATIPAAAYAGVAIGVGEPGRAGAAPAVLAVNVVMLEVAGSVTVAIQRRSRSRVEAGRAAGRVGIVRG
jgi:hypothetical protein